jgi:hypothetical protein
MDFLVLKKDGLNGHKEGSTITLRDIPDKDMEIWLHRGYIKQVKAAENKAVLKPVNTKAVKK